jgi:hypothetical protein
MSPAANKANVEWFIVLFNFKSINNNDYLGIMKFENEELGNELTTFGLYS